MDNELAFARYAPINSGGLVPGKPYLGRIRTVAKETDANGVRTYALNEGVDLYDETSGDLTKPFARVGVGSVLGAASSIGNVPGGVPLDNIFCVVTADQRGALSVEVEGIYYAWFEPLTGDAGGWSLVAVGGLSQVIPCDAGPNVPCIPFSPPFTASNVDTNFDGIPDSLNLSHGERVFVEATGPGTTMREWRAEYQACKPDDANNDAPPGIRSPWNFLASNCCKSGDTVDGDPDPTPPPDDRNCNQLALNCAITVKQCHTAMPPFDQPYKVYCRLDGSMFCATQTGGRCFCSNTFDVAGNVIPDASTLPAGTVLFVRCESHDDGGFKCSQLNYVPQQFAPYCDP
jgi:hypothetical protein